MSKRYKGGLISTTPPTTTTSIATGIWSLVEQIQGIQSGVWPITALPVSQIGTSVYDATLFGSVTDIGQIAVDPLAMSLLPNSGYLKYTLRVGTGTNNITVSYRKRNSTTLIQSAFSLFGQSLAYVDSGVSAILPADNDDHDSLFMDADGRGILSRSNTNYIPSGNWTKFTGTTTIIADNVINNVTVYPVSAFISNSQNGTIVSFPLTNSGVWINLSTGYYKTNNFSSAPMPEIMSSVIGTGTQTNSIFTISDGVNQFIIGRYTQTSAILCKVDLTTGAITASQFTYSTAPLHTNVTEEDAIGTQLFTVDGYNTYHQDTIMYYGGSLDWLDLSNPFPTAGKSTFTAGPGSTQTPLQTDMDIFGSVDSVDRSVWFADWGHDDGGLFNVRVDTELGTRKTNIKLIPLTYTN